MSTLILFTCCFLTKPSISSSITQPYDNIVNFQPLSPYSEPRSRECPLVGTSWVSIFTSQIFLLLLLLSASVSNLYAFSLLLMKAIHCYISSCIHENYIICQNILLDAILHMFDPWCNHVAREKSFISAMGHIIAATILSFYHFLIFSHSHPNMAMSIIISSLVLHKAWEEYFSFTWYFSLLTLILLIQHPKYKWYINSWETRFS